MNLFENDSDDDTFKLKTNKDYAKSFHYQKQREFLQKFKDKKSNEFDSDETSSSSEEDEVLNPEFNKIFFKTLASLKTNDPKIYDKNVKFFDPSLDIFKSNEKKSSKKPLDIEKYERKLLLETNGNIVDSDDEQTYNRRPASPTIVEEENLLKKQLKKALEYNSDEEENANWGNLFKKKKKTEEEVQTEELQYEKWLAGQEVDIGEDANELKGLKAFWDSPKLSQNEKFLRDYILNNGFADNDDDFEEETNNEDLKISEHQHEIEKQEEFEHKYNFRFEEPDQEFIKRYPRTIEHSVRTVDDKRKKKRLEVKERKEKEKEIKLQNLQVLKAIKKKEIEEKIQKLKEVTGNDELAFDNVDFDEDFDSNEHDRKMQQIFNDEYYQIDEGEQKPECPADIEDLQIKNWDEFDPRNEQNLNDNEVYYEDDEDFNMDADFNPEEENKKSLQDDFTEGTSRRKRKNRKSKFIEVLKKEKPIFDPDDERNYGQYIDEYYKLDYEDMIGDLPCRFKYVETVPNDFGLSVEEILLAKNSELNQWASLKKAVQIRPTHVEKNEKEIFKRKAQNLELKKKILKSIYGEPENEDEEQNTENTKVKESKKKKKKKNKSTVSFEETMNHHTDIKDKFKDANDEHEIKEGLPNSLNHELNKKKKKNKSTISFEETINHHTDIKEKFKYANDEPEIKEELQNKLNKKKKKNKSAISFEETINHHIDNKEKSKDANDELEIKKGLSNNLNHKLNKKKKKNKSTICFGETMEIIQHNDNREKSKNVVDLPEIKAELQKTTEKYEDNQKKNRLKRKHQDAADGISPVSKKSKLFKSKHQNNFNKNQHSHDDISDNRLRAFGIQPSKYRYKQRMEYFTNNNTSSNKMNNNKKKFKQNKFNNNKKFNKT